VTNQLFVRTLLEKMGFDVTIADNGNAAVQKVAAGSFDLILMDMQMPGMNGYEATKALREKSVTTPIIALTANAMKGDDAKCIAAGCNDYMSKPIKRDKLREIASKHLRAKETVA